MSIARSKHHRDLLANHRDPAASVAALRIAERSRPDPLGRAPLLHIELILSAARAEAAAGARQAPRARRALIGGDPDRHRHRRRRLVSAMPLALEDGFRLHRLVDPASTPPTASSVRRFGELQKLVKV